MIKVYGASDDLIEVEGDVSEEFPALREFDNGSYEDGGYLAFSDGTILRVEYAESGVWRIHPVRVEGATLTITQAPEDDEDNYSDVAVIDTAIRWVVFGSAIALK